MFSFFPDDIIRTYNDVDGGMDLSRLDKRFLLKRCKGENHHGKNCPAKVPIRSLVEHKTTSVEQVRHCVSRIELQT